LASASVPQSYSDGDKDSNSNWDYPSQHFFAHDRHLPSVDLASLSPPERKTNRTTFHWVVSQLPPDTSAALYRAGHHCPLSPQQPALGACPQLFIGGATDNTRSYKGIYEGPHNYLGALISQADGVFWWWLPMRKDAAGSETSAGIFHPVLRPCLNPHRPPCGSWHYWAWSVISTEGYLAPEGSSVVCGAVV